MSRLFSHRAVRRRARVIAAVAAAVATGVLPVSPVRAGNFTWDAVPGNGTLEGGAGTWDASTPNWTIDGGANNVVFGNTFADSATFQGTGDVVTMGVPINLNAITFSSTGYTINGSAANTLTFGGTTPTITVTNAPETATIGATLAGSAGLTFAGPGSVTLTGANTYSGATNVAGGVVQLAGGDNRLAVGGSVVLGSGANSGKLILGDATAASNQALTSLTTSGTGTTNAVVGGFTSASTLTINNGAAVAYSGFLGGAGTNENNLALTKTGAGTLTLSAANTYSGLTTVSAGTLALTSTANGVTGKYLINGSTAVVTMLTDLSLGALPAAVTPDAITLDNGGKLQSAAAANATVTVNRGITVGSGGGAIVNPTTVEYRFHSKMTGPGVLTLSDNGTQNIVIDFNATNAAGISLSDYSGGTIINGTGTGAVIPIQGSAGTPNNPTSGPFGTGTLTFAGGNFRSSGNSGTSFIIHNRLVFSANTSIPSGGTAVLFTGDTTLSGGTRTITQSSANAVTFSGVISDGGNGFGLTKAGTGAGGMTLSGLNTYSGPTNVTGGTLNIATLANGLQPSSIGQSSNAASNLVLSASTLNYTGGTVSTDRNITVSGASGLGVAATGATLTLTGSIIGSGTLTLTGAGTATPSTLVVASNPGYTGGFALANGINFPITNINQLGSGNTKNLSNTNGTTNGTYILDGTSGNLDLPFGYSITASSGATQDTIKNIAGNNTVRGPVTIMTGGGGLELNSTAGKLTMTGTITPNATARFVDVRGAGDVELTGVISNGSTLGMPLTKSAGAGTLTLSAPNTYSGGTTVSTGTLKLGNASAMGNNTALQPLGVNDRTTIASGATLDLNGQAGVRKVIVISGTGIGGAGAIINNSPFTASLDTTGALAGLFVSGSSSGLSAPPTLAFSGGGGSGAAATTTLGVTTTTFSITTGGSGYTAAPAVTIAGGGGSGATATAGLTGTTVTSITITTPGTGYTTAPTITFAAAPTGGTTATGTGNATNFQVTGATMSAFGSGYTSAPTVTPSAGTAVFTTSPATVQLAANSSLGGSGNITIPIVTGGFGLTKVGTGTVNLTGASLYTGGTTVSAGTLNVTGSLTTSSLTLAAGAKFNYTPATPATLTLANGLTLGGNNVLGINFGSTLASTVLASTTGNITLNPTGTFVSGTPYTLLSGPAGSAFSNSTYAVLNPGTFSYTLSATDTSVIITPTSLTALSAAFWKGGTSGVWAFSNGTTSNWATDAAGTDTPQVPSSTTAVTFSATGAANQTGMTLGASMSVGGITFSSTNPVSLNDDGSTLTIGGGITANAGANVTLGANIAVGAAQTWTNNSGNPLAVGSATSTVSNGSFLLTLAGSGSSPINIINFNGGAGGLTASAGSSVTISGASLAASQTWTNSSGNTLNASNVSNNGSLLTLAGTSPTVITNFVGATGGLAVSSVASVTLSGTTQLAANQTWTNNGATVFSAGAIDTVGSTLTLAGTGTTTSLAGVISGGGGITKAGTGTATMAAANTYTGPTIIDQGTLTASVDQNLPGALQFGSTPTTATAGTLNLNTNNASFGSMLVQTNIATGTVATIGSGKILTINGDVVIGSSTGTTATVFAPTGAGKFVVTNTALVGAFSVGGVSTKATGDFTGLSEMVLNLPGASSTVTVSPTSGTNTSGRFAVFKLAPTSTITAATLAIGAGGTFNSDATQQNAMFLGSGVNTINANTVSIGNGARDYGTLSFNGASGTLILRNQAGTGAAALSIGGTAGGSAAGNSAVLSALDTTGHNANMLVGSVLVGTQPRIGTNLGSTSRYKLAWDLGTVTMTDLTFGNRLAGGTLTAVLVMQTDINLGSANSTLADTATITNGILNMGSVTQATGAFNTTVTANLAIAGGTVTVGATGGTSINMLLNATAGAGTLNSGTANVSISGGVVTLSGNIIRTAPVSGTGFATTGTLALTGGTLNMSGKNIGSATTPVLDTLTFSGGTLRNLGTIFQSLTQSGASSLLDVASNDTTITGAYTASGGRTAIAATRTLAVSAGNASIADTLQLSTTATTAGKLSVTAGNLDLSAATDALDVRPTANSASALVIASYSGTRTGFFDAALLNGAAEPAPTISNPSAGQTLYTYADYNVLYDDNAKNVQLTVTNAPEPASIGLAAVAGFGLLMRRRRRAR